MIVDEPFQALIFDCDGTLVDTMPAHFVAWRQTMRRYGIEFSEDVFYDLAGVPAAKVVAHLAKDAGLTLENEKVADEKEDLFASMLDAVAPIEPVVNLARTHHGSKRMAVATGSPGWIAKRVLTAIGAIDLFETIVASEDTELHKPEPDVFLEAARRLGVAPEHCVVLEDADLGMEAARRAGMRGFDIRPYHTPRRITEAP